ncbi:MAG: rod shape-determining protein MreC [Defluviitaleaceae bacterium]|nr:rod shape-determining protein MreC [Defluviitaleaceae bacterium]
MDFVYRHKKIFLLFGMGVCVLLIILSASPGVNPSFVEKAFGFVFAPVQKGATQLTGWFGGKISNFKDNGLTRAELIKLRERNTVLELEMERYLYLENENRMMAELLEMKSIYDELSMVGARIIAKDPNDWYDSYSIEKGSDDGIERNMAVIGIGGGLVGIIREVYPTYSKFVSLIDDRFSAAVMARRTEDQAVLKGDLNLMPGGLCLMYRIGIDAQVMPGDEIVTSPLSSFFPPGIVIGHVVTIESDGNGLTQSATVKPASSVRFDEIVMVVTRLYGDENEISTAE